MSPNKDVPVLDRNGKKLCSIHCPQEWNNFIPIPLGPVIFHTNNGWKNPQAVIQWAWHQTFETYQTYNEREVPDIAKELLLDEEHCNPTLCVVCNATSIKPSRMLTLFGAKTIGIQCTNNKCSMYHVTIPWQMLANIREVPTEYIPKGFYLKK